MSIYRFVSRTGSQVEELGVMPLRDDKEAAAFGQSVVREMIQGTRKNAAVLDIFAGKRTVSRIEYRKSVQPSDRREGSSKFAQSDFSPRTDF
jgi:hypothetical protein